MSDDFTARYLDGWVAPEAEQRHAVASTLWAPDATLTVSSTGQTLIGLEAITAHIDAVHHDLIEGRGLRFSYDQTAISGDALLMRWSMTAPDDTVVGRGVDIVYRNAEGRVKTAHMFMGID